ncbi:MAG: DUF3827 domain-containing protein [Firmicutes bacterium]|nr:DUF3827 domain-containing protein [Bacillota bacterium]
MLKLEPMSQTKEAQTQTEEIPPQAVTQPRKRLAGNFWAKLRRVKNIEVYAAGLVVLIMVGIYASNFLNLGGGNETGNNVQQQVARNNNQFAREMEQRLVQTLGAVRGAGRIEAMVTVVGSATLEIAYNVDERTVTQGGPNGTTTTTVVKTPVIVQGPGGPQPMILLEIKPQIRGIVIVAAGANDMSVRLSILRAVQALVADNTVNIEILAGRP